MGNGADATDYRMLQLQVEASRIVREREKKRRCYNTYLQLMRNTVRTPGFVQLTPDKDYPIAFIHDTNPFFERVEYIATYSIDYHQAYGTLPIVQHYAQLYYEDVKDKVLVFVKEYTNEIKKIPYKTRLDDDYYSPIVAKLLKLANNKEFQYAILMTLTVNPNLYRTQYEAYRAEIEMINRLITFMRKDGKLLKGWNGHYLAISEFQPQTGMIHYHILFFGAVWADIARIRVVYERYMGKGTFFHVMPVKPIWRKDKEGKWHKYTAIHYVLKYLLKAARNFAHKAMLCALGARAFNCSRGLLTIFNIHKNNSNFRWLYLGAHPKDLMQNCNDYNDYRRIMRLDDG